MNSKIGIALVVAVGAVFALVTGPRGPFGGFWRPMVTDIRPSGAALTGLLASGLVEAVAFGVAIATLVFGGPVFARLLGTRARATAARFAFVWLLGSWWPHTALHQHNGTHPSGLAAIELVFHAGSVVAVAVLLGAVVLASRAAAERAAA